MQIRMPGRRNRTDTGRDAATRCSNEMRTTRCELRAASYEMRDASYDCGCEFGTDAANCMQSVGAATASQSPPLSLSLIHFNSLVPSPVTDCGWQLNRQAETEKSKFCWPKLSSVLLAALMKFPTKLGYCTATSPSRSPPCTPTQASWAMHIACYYFYALQ